MNKVSGGEYEEGGDGEYVQCLLCCTECGTWYLSSDMVCPNCGKSAH